MKKIISLILSFAMLCASAAVMADEDAIIDTGFEENSTGSFSERGDCDFSITQETANGGSSSLYISGRGSNAWNGVSWNIADNLKLDDTYNMSLYAKAADPNDSFTVKISLEIKDDNGTTYPQVATGKVNGSSWTLIEGSYTADYYGNLSILNFNIETDDNGIGKSFYVDDVFVAEQSVKRAAVEEAAPEATYNSYSGLLVPTDVVGTDYEKYVEVLQAIGVVEGYEDGTYRPDNTLTRAEFVTMLMRMSGLDNFSADTQRFEDVPLDHYAAGTIEAAVSSGICKGYDDTHFGPDDQVTYNQALKMVVCMLGYELEAVNSGGYPTGYALVAGDKKVKASGASGDEPLTRGQTAELLYSSIDVDVLVAENLAYPEFHVAEDTTIISRNLDIFYDKGTVDGSNTVTLKGSYSPLDTVSINGEDYYVGKTLATELIGQYVEIYYYMPDKNGDRELLYIEPVENKNETLTINAKDLESYSDHRYEYYVDSDGSETTKHVSISSDFTLIYNGRNVESGYTDDMMMPESGEIRLVSSDGGSTYDTVFITAYETYVVTSVSKSTYTVYGQNNKKVVLDPNQIDSLSIHDIYDREVALTDLQKDDVLEVAMSADGTSECDATVVRKSVSGVLTATDSDYITVDETEYEISSYLKKYGFDDLNVGSDVLVCLDHNGDAVYMYQSTGATNMTAGIVLAAWTGEDGTDNYVKLFTQTGSESEYKISSNCTVDGVKYKSTKDARTAIAGNADKALKRICLFSLNSSDELNKVDFARDADTEPSNGEGENTLQRVVGTEEWNTDSSNTYTYKSGGKVFYSSSEGSFALASGATIFEIPYLDSEYTDDTDEYRIASSSELSEGEYTIDPLKINSDQLTADYAVIYKNRDPGSQSINDDSTEYIVQKAYTSVDDDGERTMALEVYDGASKKYLFKPSTWQTWSAKGEKTPEKGDVVRFSLDTQNRIDAFGYASTIGGYTDQHYLAKGYVYMKKDGSAYMTTSKPTADMKMSDLNYIKLSDFTVLVYDKDTEEMYSGTADDIITYEDDPEGYSEVYVRMNYATAVSIICINGTGE